jgi:hypothetical protein
MGKSKKFRSPFGKKDLTGSTDQPQPPLQPESPSATFYRSISNLPLFKYRDCVVNGNLSALIITGFPPESELRSAWLDIQQEYAEIIGDQEQRNYINALKEVALLNCTLQQISICIEWIGKSLVYLPHPEVQEIVTRLQNDLNSFLDAAFVFDYNDPDKYNENLIKAARRAKGIKLSLDVAQANLESLQGVHDKQEKPTDAYFQNILITLSDAAGYYITDTITVLEFAQRIKRMNDGKRRIN